MAESPVGEEVAGAQCPGCPTSTTWSPAREEMPERGEVQSTEMGVPLPPPDSFSGGSRCTSVSTISVQIPTCFLTLPGVFCMIWVKIRVFIKEDSLCLPCPVPSQLLGSRCTGTKKPLVIPGAFLVRGV